MASNVESVDGNVKFLIAKVSAFAEDLKKVDQEHGASFQNSDDNQSQSQMIMSTHAATFGKEIFDCLLQIVKQSSHCAKIKVILGSLRFTGMESRREQIADAHRRTCNWILDEGRPDGCPDPKFLQWLKVENGFYWISGKAGSGKSTLVKFLSRSTKVRQALKSWAGSDELLIASHFFYSPGNEAQQTKEGLFQTLLYEIFRQCPRMIPEIAAGRWSSEISRNPVTIPWTSSELAVAFERLRSRDITLPRMCFFIDGLDEYNKEPEELIKIIAPFATCPHIKICVSSRPWNQFKAFFGGNTSQSLQLQDFNRPDIDFYVTEAFEENEDFLELQTLDPRYKLLRRQISKEAKGVFLWATLAVRSILRGLSNADPFQLLEERLRTFPEDIGQMYRTMLTCIEPIYRHSTARIFQVMMFLIAIKSSSSLQVGVLDFAFLDEPHPEFAKKMVVKCRDLRENHNQCIRTGKQINAWTAGLLDIRHVCHKLEIGRECKVDLIHKTLQNYLNSEGAKLWLQGGIPEMFNVPQYSASACLAQMKILASCLLGYHEAVTNKMVDDYNPNALSNIHSVITRLEVTFMNVIASQESEQGIMEVQIVVDMEHVLQTCADLISTAAERLKVNHPMFGRPMWTTWIQSRQEPGILMQRAIKKNLSRHVSNRLENSLEIFSIAPWSPLMMAIESVNERDDYDMAAMVRLLLDHGADANARLVGVRARLVRASTTVGDQDGKARYGGRPPSPSPVKNLSGIPVDDHLKPHHQRSTTPWKHLLESPALRLLEERYDNPDLPLPPVWAQKWFEIVEMLARANADMDVLIADGDDEALCKPRDIIYKYCTEEQIARLKDVLDSDLALRTPKQPGNQAVFRAIDFFVWLFWHIWTATADVYSTYLFWIVRNRSC